MDDRMTSKHLRLGAFSIMLLGMAGGIEAQTPDPNFHVYLAFGQSNMEGQGKNYSGQDKVENARFKVMSAVTCSSPSRTQGSWSPAIAPIVRCNTYLSPLDYFGRTLVDSLPSSITIGVVPVAVAGSKIEGFDQSTYQSYYSSQASWMTSIVSQYGGNPYARLVAVAKEAQKSGVIKGILLHQGESNTGDAQWANKVKAIYNSLLKDLGLTAANVPLLAGEVAPTGVSSGANTMIDALPQTIPTAHVVSAKSLTIDNSDGQNVHFDAASYRELGKRYAQAMLKILPSVGVAPLANKPSPDMSYVVYDVDGSRIAGFRTTESASMTTEWNRVRHSLPNGIYWIKGTSATSAIKAVNGL